MEKTKKNLDERSKKTIAILKEDLNTVRAGRANPALLDKVMVDYYGSPTPLKNLANISVPDPRTLLIAPFDPKSIAEIEKAINVANIGINPSNDGKAVRLVIPQVTEERRKELTKTVKKMGEDSKVAIRNLRREANDEMKKLEKNHEITEDELKKRWTISRRQPIRRRRRSTISSLPRTRKSWKYRLISGQNNSIEKEIVWLPTGATLFVGETMNEAVKMPQHVAIIMDGNGRWAAQHKVSRLQGHNRGMLVMKEIIKKADVMGIRHLTVYAFSTENWKRSQEEVGGIFNLLVKFVGSELAELDQNNVKVHILGDYTKVPDAAVRSIEKALQTTSSNTGLQFHIALNYGSRAEMTRGVRKLCAAVRSGTLAPEDIDEKVISESLYTGVENGNVPDPDLIIRTSGEQRLSNFLLWQAAYSEFVFTDTLWPDFTPEEFEKLITEFTHRDRRFGGR